MMLTFCQASLPHSRPSLMTLDGRLPVPVTGSFWVHRHLRVLEAVGPPKRSSAPLALGRPSCGFACEGQHAATSPCTT